MFYVYGYGRMGKAIVHALVELGQEVKVYDINTNQKLPIGATWVSNEPLDPISNPEFFKGDTVISALPYTENLELARRCIHNGVHYFDLGGCVEVSADIKKFYTKHGKGSIVFTDLGLAPGLINIMAEDLVNNLTYLPHTIQMAVGGFSDDALTSPVKYDRSWSTEGLINEFVEPYELLANGEITVSDVRHAEPDFMSQELELIPTAGGFGSSAGSFKKSGILNAGYVTIRPKGFYELFKHFLDQGLTAKDLEKIYPVNHDDAVHMRVTAVSNDGQLTVISKNCYADPELGFSAMQMTTGFTIAIVAYLYSTASFVGYQTYESFLQHFWFGDLKNLFNSMVNEENQI